MNLRNWLDGLYFGFQWRRAFGNSAGNAGKRHPRRRINIERLEDRTLLSAMVAIDDSYTMSHDRVFNGNVISNDQPPGPEVTLSATLITDVSHGSLSLSPNGTFTYTPAEGFVGEDTFYYQACADAPFDNVACVTITVRETPPTAYNFFYLVAPNETISFNLISDNIDEDGDEIRFESFEAQGDFEGVLEVSSTGLVTFVADQTEAVYVFGYTVTDGLEENSGTFAIIVRTNSGEGDGEEGEGGEGEGGEEDGGSGGTGGDGTGGDGTGGDGTGGDGTGGDGTGGDGTGGDGTGGDGTGGDGTGGDGTGGDGTGGDGTGGDGTGGDGTGGDGTGGDGTGGDGTGGDGTGGDGTGGDGTGGDGTGGDGTGGDGTGGDGTGGDGTGGDGTGGDGTGGDGTGGDGTGDGEGGGT